ncbi:F-box/LRR-repeat protein 2 isoform X6 [Rhinolophus ferrumequinum]|uniref:F-box/LRR-repeat protein 2 isoform X6 n=1 Tax=Rhinolophus ferrumequinum TaxID=59479 RepID=UPI00140F87C9|nr:F-box/LRR-repeat protein 2 isoform X6 [Rhinolophus ferrumequinum]
MVFSNNDEGLINKKLPKELLLRMLFSLLLNFTWSNPECTKYVHNIGLDSFCNVHSMDFFKDGCLHLLLMPYIYIPGQPNRIFSFLDIVTLCRCAQISKAWNILALDGSNWQRIDLFNFQTDVEGRVVENISKRCGGFLRKLSLRGCIGVGDSSLKTFAQNCRNIEHLNLNGCTKITDSTCYSLSRFCSKLKHLDLTSCVSITNSSLKGISEGCRNLEYLNLSWCDQITKDGVEALVRGCRGLKALLLRGCTQLEDEALKHIQNYCQELVSLNLQSCSRITDGGVVQICRGCHRLQALCLSGCGNLTDASLTALALNCPRLQILEAARCSHLTDAGFTLLARNCHDLEKMDLEECVLEKPELGIKFWCRSHTDTACFSPDNRQHTHPALHSLS